jgi:hypothetical protein
MLEYEIIFGVDSDDPKTGTLTLDIGPPVGEAAMGEALGLANSRPRGYRRGPYTAEWAQMVSQLNTLPGAPNMASGARYPLAPAVRARLRELLPDLPEIYYNDPGVSIIQLRAPKLISRGAEGRRARTLLANDLAAAPPPELAPQVPEAIQRAREKRKAKRDEIFRLYRLLGGRRPDNVAGEVQRLEGADPDIAAIEAYLAELGLADGGPSEEGEGDAPGGEEPPPAKKEKEKEKEKEEEKKQAPEAGRVEESPWTNYSAWATPEGRHDPCCLINELIERYAVRPPKSRAIAESSIRKHFGDTPTIERLLAFAERYQIPLRVWSTLGAQIASHSPKGGKGGRKSGLALVAYGEHAYIYTEKGPGGKDAPVTQSAPVLKPGASALGARTVRARDTLDEDGQWIYDRLVRMVRVNFMYQAEEGVGPRSLRWEAEHDDGGAGGQTWGLDQNSAFWSSLQGAEHQVPVFTPHDDIVECELQPGEKCDPSAYYYATEEAYASWSGRAEGLLCARVSSVLHGFEANYLLERGLLAPADLGHVKKARHYTIEAADLRKIIDSLGEEAETQLVKKATDAELRAVEAEGGSMRKNFALYNGLLGVLYTGRWSTALCVAERDAELLEATLPDRVSAARTELVGPFPEHTDTSMMVTAKGIFRNLNTRHLYHYIIAQCNLELMKKHDQLAPQTGRLVRVATDELGYASGPPGTPEHILKGPGAGWKRATRPFTKLRVVEGLGAWTDPRELIERIRAEIYTWTKEHTIITGAPGTGKTHRVQHEQDYAAAFTITNLCARNMNKAGKPNGDTLHRGFQLFRPDELGAVCARFAGRLVWIDEFSMINPWIWGVVWAVGLNTQFVLTGDPNQCPPVGGGAEGVATEKLPWTTGLFLQRLLGAAEPMTRDRRNDAGLIALRRLVNQADRPYYAYKKFCQEYEGAGGVDRTGAPEEEILKADYHIVYGNKYRHRLNLAIIKARGYEWSHIDGAWTISKGVRLRATVTKRRGKASGYLKGEQFVLMTAARGAKGKKQYIHLAPAAEYKAGRAGKLPVMPHAAKEPAEKGAEWIREIPAEELKNFTPAYAVTAPSSQGLTIKEPAVVHQMRAMLGFDGDNRELAYTAITRLTRLEHLMAIDGQLALAEPARTQQEIWWLEDDDDEVDEAIWKKATGSRAKSMGIATHHR